MLDEAEIQETNVSAAFSAQSAIFDEIDEKNLIIQWMRAKVREHVLAYWKAGESILELNAGTGLDAIYFAQKGINVHATDNASGMLSELSNKVATLGLANKITVQQCSFSELSNLNKTGFNHIFSNFGGLNCTDKLNEVIESFYNLLKPGGTVTLVLMPPVCPWELMLALKGNFKVAFRRLKKGGAPSHLEGKYFMTHYYSSARVKKMFGRNYNVESIKGLGIAIPPPYLEDFPVKHPRIYKSLVSVENSISGLPVFRSCADHFIITMRKKA
jgi:ubiquinone/menaquinone biosynthesis C-methylase UbiE